jgi:hypothetical protein
MSKVSIEGNSYLHLGESYVKRKKKAPLKVLREGLDLYNRFGIYIARRHVQTEQTAHPSSAISRLCSRKSDQFDTLR